jgi:hypothetical protein
MCIIWCLIVTHVRPKWFLIYLIKYLLFLFNNTVSISGCVESNFDMMMDNEYEKDVEGSSHVKVWCTVLTFV